MKPYRSKPTDSKRISHNKALHFVIISHAYAPMNQEKRNACSTSSYTQTRALKPRITDTQCIEMLLTQCELHLTGRLLAGFSTLRVEFQPYRQRAAISHDALAVYISTSPQYALAGLGLAVQLLLKSLVLLDLMLTLLPLESLSRELSLLASKVCLPHCR